MKQKRSSIAQAVLGAALMAAGAYLLKTAADPQGIMRALPYVFLGLGCGIFGQGAGTMIGGFVEKRNPEAARSMQIEKNDERNAAVSNRAKAKAFDVMIFVFGALILALALMSADIAVILLTVSAYLFVAGCAIYYRMRYDKEM